MKLIVIIFILFGTILTPCQAQIKQKRTNVFLFDNPVHKKFWSRTFYWRAKWHSIFSKGNMVAFRASSPEDAAQKIEKILKRKNSKIGSLWIDSHGYYYNRLSTFCVGGQGVNYKTIYDSSIRHAFQRIVKYCDEQSKITIGACFAGATFDFPDKNNLKGRRMNGDSLLLAMGVIFKETPIYASQSWVMEGFGLWKSKYKLAGAPLQKRYKDVLFKPAWENLGKWEKFDPITKQIKPCNTISLTKRGVVFEKNESYFNFKKTQRKIYKHLPKLKSGLYKNELKV